MKANEFETHALTDPNLSALLHEVAAELQARGTVKAPPKYTVTGVDALLGLVAYVLFRWVNGFFGQRRALTETRIAEQRAALVTSLVKDGWDPTQAQALVGALFKAAARHTDSGPALQAALLLGRRSESS